MKSIARLFNAVATLAGSLESLAGLVDTLSGKIRVQVNAEVLEAAAEVQALPAPGDNAAVAEPASRRKSKATS
jgi:hypothetical protein